MKIFLLAFSILIMSALSSVSQAQVGVSTSVSFSYCALTISGTVMTVGVNSLASGPPNDSDSISDTMYWSLIVTWSGSSPKGAPVGSGAAVVGLTKKAQASAASHVGTSAGSYASCDAVTSTAYVSGAVPPDIEPISSSSSTYTVNGSSLSFTLVGTNSWEAQYSFTSMSVYSYSQALANYGSKGANASSYATVVTDSNYGLDSTSIAVTAHP